MTVRIRNNVQIHGPAGGTGDGLTAPTVGEDGYVAIADGGDLTYLPGTSDGDVLTWVDATQEWTAAAPGEGDVHGPSSSVDNQVVRFDGETGKIIQGGTAAPSYDDNGNLSVNYGTELRIWETDGTHFLGFSAPTLAATEVWVLPAADGTAGQALVTDGDGNLSFASVGAGSGVTDHGALRGLSDTNDHTWAFLIDGTRTAAYIKFGTYPATEGYVRLPNDGAIYSRNYANDDNLQIARVTGTVAGLILGESGLYSVNTYASVSHGWHLGSYELEFTTSALSMRIGASVMPLQASGEQAFYRYHSTACVATEGGRSTLAPMDVS